jgi:hypothetical protein
LLRDLAVRAAVAGRKGGTFEAHGARSIFRRIIRGITTFAEEENDDRERPESVHINLRGAEAHAG